MGMSTERVPVRVFENDKQAAKVISARIAEIIRAKAQAGEQAVLGLATGHTPINVYRELIRLRREEGLDFANVVTFNLDEYWPIRHDAMQSYHTWMARNFFDHVNIAPANIHLPSGEVPQAALESHCRAYEAQIAQAGGIDFQILGIGRSGHVGFNEPGSSPDSPTRAVRLDRITRKDAAADFFGEENVPQLAITMGVGAILRAREIALLGFGEHKAPIIRRAVEEGVTPAVAASYLQRHERATFYLDEASAADLTRLATPWVLGACQWDDILQRQAVIWLARKLEKPILKLTDEDYAENGLLELLHLNNGCYQLNINVFRRLMNTITGWPGGKEKKRRILVLSPHPDDDVICMAGTMTRFVQQGHELHVAYMVSGCLSVFDHDALRHAEFVKGFNDIFGLSGQHAAAIEEHIEKFLRQKTAGQLDSAEVQAVKALIRRTEAIAAAQHCGLTEGNLHFLNMPFYDTGMVAKLPIGPDDVKAVYDLLAKVEPEMIFAAGDLSDPHGTHRMCLEAALAAVEQYAQSGKPRPEVWLYRGAWQEWPPERIDMAVPLAPDELAHKRQAIFRHQSQKDRAMFPGPYDSREFWQRAEDRNQASAATYDALGLPEYHAIEAFVRHPLPRSAHAQAQLG
jgi:glucosamine-6-phosphate deaminase